MNQNPVDHEITEGAKAMANEVNLHILSGNKLHWACFWMKDGTPVDHVPYPSRIQAVTHMRWNRDEVIYVEIPADHMTEKEAEAYIRYNRFLYSQGWRLPSPDFDYAAGMPAFKSDRLKTARHLISGGTIR